MSENRYQVPKPLAPRDEVLQAGDFVMQGRLDGHEMLCCYDPERRTAATFHVGLGMWRMQCPISADEYLTGLQAAGVELPDGADLQRWLDAVLVSPRGTPH
jgi:hypothetical protein